MLFCPKKLLLGAAYLLFASSVAADDCQSGPWTDVLNIGGPGGDTEFCSTKWMNGIVVTGVEVWANAWAVTGIQLYFSDGTDSGVFGHENGDRTDRLTWDPSTDSISQLKMWGNGQGQFTGRVQIRTKTGLELDVGKDTSGQDTYEIKVNSGIMLGALGKSGDSIDVLGFLFLKSTVSKISMENVTFQETPDELNARKQGLKTAVIDYADHTNNSPTSNDTFSFGHSIEQETTKTYSNTATHNYGIQQATEVSGDLLGIAPLKLGSTTTLSYQYSNAKTEETAQQETVTLTYSVSTTLKPGQRIFCRATATNGVYNGNYDATVSTSLAYYRTIHTIG